VGTILGLGYINRLRPTPTKERAIVLVLPSTPAPTSEAKPPSTKAPAAPVRKATFPLQPAAPARANVEEKQAQPVQEPPAARAPILALLHAPAPFKRRDLRSADELCRELLRAPEVNLDRIAGTSTRLLTLARSQQTQPVHVIGAALAAREDLIGLPMRMGMDCQLGKESAENLQALSLKLRGFLGESTSKQTLDNRHDAYVLRNKLLKGQKGQPCEWIQRDALPALLQLLQAEEKPVRELLIDLLTTIKGRETTIALAQRALFDVSDEVREAAINALRQRPAVEYRPVLLEGFRYPWAPVADHAAEALVNLEDRMAVPKLVSLLDEPDPAAPESEGPRKPAVLREVVRINHLRNCLLCHAPSFETTEPVRARIPTPGQPLEPPTAYYASQDTFATFVRADITYLRPDFSVPQPVIHSAPWPVHQRYDYSVRARYATRQEVSAALAAPESYLQREAVLFALRELTGVDGGASKREWERLLVKN
jgi:hypothetical protein